MSSKQVDGLYVFVDNSNIWIEGKRISGRTLHPAVNSDYWYRLDSGKLLDLELIHK
jgi:hypothetical protein